MNTCFFVFAARQETSTGLIVQRGSVTSFILSAGPHRHTTNTRWAALSAGQPLQKEPPTKREVKKSGGQGAGPGTPLTYIIDLVNNGHLIPLHADPAVRTRGSLSPSSKKAYYTTTCVCLSGHNERLVIGERPRPLAEPSAEGLAASMGSLYPAERDGQCQTRLAQRREQCGHVGKAWASCRSSRDPTQWLLQGHVCRRKKKPQKTTKQREEQPR